MLINSLLLITLVNWTVGILLGCDVGIVDGRKKGEILGFLVGTSVGVMVNGCDGVVLGIIDGS